MRRIVAASLALAALAGLAGGAVWFAKRTVRWRDARTMPPPLEAAVRAYAKGDDARGLDGVRTLLRRYKAPAWQGRARVLAATRLAASGHERDIPDWLPGDLAESDPLFAHALLLRARGALARDQLDRAAELAGRAAAVPGFPGGDDARLARAAAQDRAGRWREALATLDPRPGADTAVAAARIAATHGDTEGARRRLLAALADAKSLDDSSRVRAAIEDLPPSPGASRPGIAARAQRWLDDGTPLEAVEILRAVRAAGAPSAASADEALIEAEALLKLGRTAEMKPLLANARAAGGAHRDGAAYLDARAAAAAGRFAAFRVGLESLARGGAPPWRHRALADLARAGEGTPSLKTLEAWRQYRAAAGADADPLALLREAWAAYDLGRLADADAGFARAIARPDAPDGVRVTAEYWRARIAEANGRTASARAGYERIADAYENHYYGALAAKRLGRPLPAAPVASAAAPAPATRWLAAARALVSVGLWDPASECYRSAVREAGAKGTAIAYEAAQAADAAAATSDAIGFAQMAVGDRERARAATIPRGLWRLLYPAPSGERLAKAARESGLEPSLVAAIALQESGFNPLAVSAAGARGLLQVMPAVGAELARSAGLRQFNADDLFDPEINAKLGAAHFREYLRRFGSVPRALAAYNAGPARVERWTAPAGHEDDDRFVERIPIPETRLYVKRVLTGARMYAIAWPDGLGAR